MKLKRLIKEQEQDWVKYIQDANKKFKSQWGVDLKLNPQELISKGSQSIRYPDISKINPFIHLVTTSIEFDALVRFNDRYAKAQLVVTINLMLNVRGFRGTRTGASTEYRYEYDKWQPY